MIEITKEALTGAAQSLTNRGPIHMVNLLRYRPQAKYQEDLALPAATGREVYLQRYVAAFARVSAKVAPGEAFKPIFLGAVGATLVASPVEVWDDVVIVEYPSFDTLRKIVTSPEYETEAAPHHRAALSDWRLLATLRVELSAS
jgi:hypothetical protein